ncbi:antibiotic biosynthesis monooxygenase [Streptomyces sp. NPDC051320]|uniref:antibiotic biosynthesis monooxygenase n=1 Tax=Streptomyces sp. NPDC051320 TaxID=3154644 RepID=UPI00341B0105
MTPPEPLPHVSRPDAGTTLISEWIVGTPARQRMAADALLSEWRELSARFRPEGFLQLSCFAGADGRVLLSHAQWTDDDAHLAFVREHRPDMVNRIDRDVPGIERPGLARYEALRSVALGAGPADVVGLVRAEARTAKEARSWADTVAGRLRDESPAGISAAHLLLSKDGKHALLYALGTSRHGSPDLPATAEGGVRVHAPQYYRLLGSVRGPEKDNTPRR